MTQGGGDRLSGAGLLLRVIPGDSWKDCARRVVVPLEDDDGWRGVDSLRRSRGQNRWKLVRLS